MSVEALNKREVHDGLLLSTDELRSNFLFGIDLRNNDGVEMSKELMEFHIRAATEWLQVEIPGLLLCEQDVDEWQDFYAADYLSYNFLKLYKYPAQSVQEISITYPLSTTPVIFDPKWYRLTQVGQQAMLIPTTGTFSSILLTNSGAFVPFFHNASQNVPLVWNIKYRAGFAKSKLPMNIKELIGMKAALAPLAFAGDLLLGGVGVSSKSLSMDGLSQSVSANQGYTARINQYQKLIEDHLSKLRTYYGGINMVVA